MRIPIPERFRLKSVIIFIVVVAIAQQVEKTDVTFSLLTSLYIALFALAFNAGGGLYFLAGAYIFFNATLSALVGIVYKCVLGEPGQGNLLVPNTTMAAYCAAMAGLLVAAGLSRRFIPPRGLLSSMAPGPAMKQAAMGCLIFGILLQAASQGVQQAGSLGGVLIQLNNFIPLSVILGTYYEVLASNGKRSVNWIVLAGGGWIFFYGAIVFSKQGLFTPFVAWLLPAAALGYNFSKKQVIIGLLCGFYMVYYLVPFSQYGRLYRTESGGGNFVAAVQLLRHPVATRELYLENEQADQREDGPHYFNNAQGLFDREEMLSFDDTLIQWSSQGHYLGIQPTLNAFLNAIPHFIWAGKPTIEYGNDYMHEMGLLPEDDVTTGISFSPVSDGFHQAGLFGAGVLFPAVAFLLFVIGDSLCGDVRRSPWGLLLIVLAAHIAPEGLISGAVYLMTYSALAVLLAALLARYALPILAGLLLGNERTRVRRTMEFRPVLRGARINPLLREPMVADPVLQPAEPNPPIS